MLLVHLQPLARAIVSLLVITALILSFVMLGSHWIKNHIVAFAVESWLIAALSALMAVVGHYPELFVVAVVTAFFRGSLLPYLLNRIIVSRGLRREFSPLFQPASSLVGGGFLVLFSYALSHKLVLDMHLTNPLALLALTAMFSLQLIGFLMLVLRTEAVSAILGLLVIENGIFLGSQILVPGMPLLLEIVILFDLLIIVSTFGILIRYLQREIGTTSSRHLTRLVG